MPSPDPVTPLAPWQTAWPAGVALLGLLVAAWRARRHLRPSRADAAWMVGLWAAALGVRLFVVPAWSLHTYDGHEAEYWDIFRGVRPLGRGGTVLYPSMQWMWWGLGKVLPHHPRVPLAWTAMLSSAGCVVVASAARAWTGRAGAVVAGLVLTLHPVLAAWSSSAYNVALPWTFSAVVLWCAAHLGHTRNAPVSVAWLGAFAWALVAATRLEAAWIALPALGVAVAGTPPGQPWRRAMVQRVRWLWPAGVGLVVGAAAVLPLVYPGEVPGAGERWVSFLINRGFAAPYAPLDSVLGGVAVVAVIAVAVVRKPWVAGIAVISGVAVHFGLSTFDDFGDRHTLGTLLLLAAVVGIAWHGRGRLLWVGRGAGMLVLVLLVVGLVDMRGRFYGSEETYTALLDHDARWRDLPRWTPEVARQDCGWIAEDPRVAPQPQRSHFNLIDPQEAQQLRGKEGCLRWCVDVQDWRWSSRGVRDRAARTARLFPLQPVAVVEDAGSGYACLVMELGLRRCCPTPHSVADPDAEPPFLARDPSLEEDDALGFRQYSRLP